MLPRTGITRFSQTNFQGQAMSYYRTPDHRKMRAELINQWKPWQKSTGPRTDAGKAKSAANSRKHGNRSRKALEDMRWLREFLRECSEVTG